VVANWKHLAWPRPSEGLPLPHLHRLGCLTILLTGQVYHYGYEPLGVQ
jgi:hypothetical protein